MLVNKHSNPREGENRERERDRRREREREMEIKQRERGKEGMKERGRRQYLVSLESWKEVLILLRHCCRSNLAKRR